MPSLITSILVIDKGRVPDFDAARRHIEALTVREMYESLSDEYSYAEELFIDESSDEDTVANAYKQAERVVKDLLECVDLIESGWANEHDSFNKYNVRDLTILVTGDFSFGDSIPTCDAISKFDLCGAASVAGFDE
jgi:hypothetical protein